MGYSTSLRQHHTNTATTPNRTGDMKTPDSVVLSGVQFVGRRLTKPLPAAETSTTKGTCDDGAAATSSSHSSSDENQPLDADLRRLIDAWPKLPDVIRAGILAMVDAVADG